MTRGAQWSANHLLGTTFLGSLIWYKNCFVLCTIFMCFMSKYKVAILQFCNFAIMNSSIYSFIERKHYHYNKYCYMKHLYRNQLRIWL